MSLLLLIYVTAFITACVSASGKCPAWVPLILLCIAGLLTCLPLR